MRKGSGLSAGELVTYQLYFNKIQSSYNQLVNLLSSFTRAGGAAQRVLGLLKAMPSTDAGGDAPQGGGRGAALAYDDVHFTYASRPDAPARHSLKMPTSARYEVRSICEGISWDCCEWSAIVARDRLHTPRRRGFTASLFTRLASSRYRSRLCA